MDLSRASRQWLRTVTMTCVLAATLAACTHPVAKHDRTGLSIPGPVAIGESRRPIAGGCRQHMGPWSTCNVIFEDQHGHQVDAHRMAASLDRTAAAIPQLAPWVRRVEGNSDSELPYEFHLLTISPDIVLVIPRAPGRPQSCGSVYQDGCVQSMGFRAHSYWYRSPPPVRSGSFWFSSAQPVPTPISAADGDITISVENAVVRLTPVEGHWRVFRVK